MRPVLLSVLPVALLSGSVASAQELAPVHVQGLRSDVAPLQVICFPDQHVPSDKDNGSIMRLDAPDRREGSKNAWSPAPGDAVPPGRFR